MAITRSSISKQLEPGLGSCDKAKFKKVLEKTHGKIYKYKKLNSKKAKVQNLPFKSGTIQEVVQPQKGEVIHSQCRGTKRRNKWLKKDLVGKGMK